MEWSKIKNIILLMLLLVNAILLALLAARYFSARQNAWEAWRDCISVFDKNGITLQLDEAPEGEGLEPLRAERDKEAEAAAAASFLGEVTTSEPGGGVLLCDGALGEASFRAGGEFSVTLAAGAVSAGTQDAGSHALSLLKKMGLRADTESLATEETDGATVVSVSQAVDGAPVFTCTASFTYESGALTSVSGRWVLAEPRADSRSESLGSPATALLLLLRHVMSAGDVCKEVTAVTAGYQVPATLSDPIKLTPVWRITTDTGLYYVNTESASVERAA